MTPLEIEVKALRAIVMRAERERRQYWPVPIVGGGASAILPYFTILGGNTLVAPVAAGIIYRSDTVSASELPAGSGGTGTVIMPAWPIPSGLPNGVGVCRQDGTANYYFVLLDSTNLAGVNSDVKAGRGMFGYADFNMDVVVGPVTYRYVFKAMEGIN